ncbi:hypothetical protein P691DRAFT_764854 [Macrolepiota fuliginosa MF-IS2]|uniref:Uncharacterized protein n=1 Tax=Macrolepiota fuliginosa MF-IS2 TaxID=1400762 RepID=A0A9P5X1L0_9AGAR|nr:hypothetical protein P691DRAFT_764854 [Macrolepiota fuliginosa MF-IS2]
MIIIDNSGATANDDSPKHASAPPDTQGSETGGVTECPPLYTYPQNQQPIQTISQPPTMHTQLSSLPSSSQSTRPLTRAPRIHPHPVLRIQTTPFESHTTSRTNTSNERSTLRPTPRSPDVDCARPTRHALLRFITSIFVALGILFLWLILVQGIRFFLFGGPPFWGPRSPPWHHGPRGPHSPPPRDRPQMPEVVKPSFGISRPYEAYSTRYLTPTMVTMVRRPMITADR